MTRKHTLSPLALLALALIFFASAVSVVRAIENDEAEDDDDVEVIPEVARTASEEAEGEDSGAGDVVHVEDEVPDFDTLQVEPALSSAPGVESVYLFPNNMDKIPEIHAGEPTEILVGLVNNGDAAVEVSSVKGALVHPMDFRLVLQNYSAVEYRSTILPGDAATFHFSFTPDKKLQPREFGLTTLLLYTMASVAYANTAYNGSVEILEAKGSVSGEFLFLVLLGVGLLALGGAAAATQLQKLGKGKGKKGKKVEMGTKTPSPEVGANEWLQGTSVTLKQGRAVTQQRKRKV